MWILTNRGPLSIVRDRNSDRILVRARQRKTIEDFVGTLGEVFEDHEADYPYRAFMSKLEFMEAFYPEVERITYPNFKNSVKDRVLHELYSKVWSTLSVLGMGRRYRQEPPRRLSVAEFEALPAKVFDEGGNLADEYHFYEDPTLEDLDISNDYQPRRVK